MKNKAGFFLVCAAVLILTGCGKKLSGDEYLAKAKAFVAEGNHQTAIIELKNALTADRQNPEIRLLLGKSYLYIGEFASAEKELQKARENGAPDDEVVPMLAEALQFLGEHDQLMELDAATLDDPENRSALLAAQGASALAAGDEPQANKLIEEALAVRPNSAKALLAAATLALHNNSTEIALQRLDQTLKVDPEYAAAWSFQGAMSHRSGNLELAEAAYTKAIKLTPNNSTDHLQRALIRIQEENFVAAQEDIDELLKRFTQHPGVSYAQGLVQLHNKDLAAAKTSLDTATLAGDSYPLAYFYLASIHLQEGNQAQAERNATKFLSLAPDHPGARKMSASIKLQAAKFKGAEGLLRPVVAAFPNDVEALNLLATSLTGQSKSDQALELLNKVVELQPDSAIAQASLGQELLAAGRESLGLEHLKAALQLDPKLQKADTTLILYYLRQKDFDAAIEAGEDYRVRHPEAVAPNNLLGQVYIAAGEDENARKAYKQVLELEAGNANANHGLAFLAEQAGDASAARVYYETVLQHHKNYLPSLIKLAALDAREGDYDAMQLGLKRAIDLYPQAVEPRWMLSRYYIAHEQPARALVVLNGLDAATRSQPAILQVLARAELAQKNYSAAIGHLEALAEKWPAMADTHYQLAMAYAGDGESYKAQLTLQQTIQLDPNHFPARIALARFLLIQRDMSGLEGQMVELRRLAPDNSDVLQLEGVLATLKEDPQAALEKLQLAYEGNPSTTTLLTLVRHQYALGNTSAAKSLMQEWLDEHPDDVSTRIALAEFYLQEGQREGAMSEFQRVLEADGQNVVALNNLAWNLMHSDPARALPYAELAAKLKPGEASIIDTLAMVLLANKDLAHAQRSIGRAITLNPSDPSLHYHAAQIMAASGDKQGAIAILSPLLKTGVGFPQKDEATQFLAELEQ